MHSDIQPSPARGTPLFWPVALLSIASLLAMSWPNLADPIIRHDDFPAYFAEGERFWPKTLNEGRWLNYWWHLRGVVTPAWANHALYQILWAVTVSALVVLSMRRSENGLLALAACLFILSAPMAMLISLWFNTLIPGMACLALYAVLGMTLSARALRMLLPPFVLLGFWAYTTYPVILLAICIAASPRSSLRDLLGLLVLFTLSFVGAVLMTYALNWQVHGIFGIPLAEWRTATPASDLAGLAANLPVYLRSLGDFVGTASYGLPVLWVLHAALLLGAAVIVVRYRPVEAVWLLAGLVTGFGLLAAQVLLSGAYAPPRAFLFVWIFHALFVLRAARLSHEGPARMGRILTAALLCIGVLHAVLNAQHLVKYRAWQDEVRALAGALARIDPGATRPVLVSGPVLDLPSARKADIQHPDALAGRLRLLSGRRVLICSTPPSACREDPRLDGLPAPLFVEILADETRIVVGVDG